jgi:hypothetical protein
MKEYKVKVTEKHTKWYNLEGQLHREDGPAIEFRDGYKAYYINGKRHREDGPAVDCGNKYKCYYINNKLHREDGPAVEYANGDKSYYINDEELTEEEFNNRTKTCEGKVVVVIEGVKYKLSKL